MSDPAPLNTPDPSPAVDTPKTNGGTPHAPAKDAGEAQKLPLFCVANIRAGQPDGRNETVEYVFFKRTGYAIYQCKEKIIVCYSDDPDCATKQIAQIAELIALRDQLQYLTMGSDKLAHCYREAIAEALRLGLEGKIEVAKQALTAAIDDVKETMARKSRADYLIYAGPLAAVCALIFFYAASRTTDNMLMRHLFVATGAGAVGGLLSIAIAIRQRTVVSDGHKISNIVDGTVRLMMAVISATALFLLLSSGVLHDVTVGSAKFSGGQITGSVAFLIGFAAGFLERLLPDLLEKGTSTAANPSSSGNKTAGTNTGAIAAGGAATN